MASCVVFCAGGFDRLITTPAETDYIIAADGGYRHTEALGLQPTAVLGDFDSLGYVPKGAELFPVEKDDTDAMLAARHGLALGYRHFLFYGALDGARLDHTVANFQTLQFLADRKATGYLVGLSQIVTVVQNGTLRFPKGFTGNVSVFCLGTPAKGVTLQGLHYSLEQGVLTPDFPLGVSNSFVGEKSAVQVEEGSLFVIYDRHNGVEGVVHETQK